MNKLIKFIKENPRFLMTMLIIMIGIALMLYFGIDTKAVAIVAIVVGYITNAFAGLSALISLVPFIGPLIVKVFTIPFFWLLNGLGYFTSAYAIKKGYAKDVVNHRIITFVLLIGIVIGYILGHLVPLR
ncbi:MAG: hypothetical protein ISR90_03810 [Candidatus Marinimicrobia bacterium]|nr:hypothetical protein [Candidatus Neomarinimicrobiota bacterium]MBL7023166.1 hypothetical protein [Candidatus Neomarinimicrobiota bacterium]MBL7109026.1 hypothetical protein [Candidatus Neomarinimicrobiota bacterium]